MRIVREKLQYYWKLIKDFCVLQILHADDPPHRLALGIAVGIFVAFMPLVGIQMGVTVFLAWLVGANKLVGVPLVWITNPVTIIPIYYPCYRFGCALLGEPVLTERWSELGQRWTVLAASADVSWGEKVKFWWGGLMDFVLPLCVGCLVVSTVLGILSYYISLYAIRAYRLRRWGQLMPPSASERETRDDSKEPGAELQSSETKSSETKSGETAA